MKPKVYARRVRRIRFLLMCLAVAGVACLELDLGKSFASKLSQTSAMKTDSPPPPDVSMANFVALAH
jgi:hypothetical protein